MEIVICGNYKEQKAFRNVKLTSKFVISVLFPNIILPSLYILWINIYIDAKLETARTLDENDVFIIIF